MSILNGCRIRVALLHRPDLIDYDCDESLVENTGEPPQTVNLEFSRFFDAALAINDDAEFERFVSEFERGGNSATAGTTT